MKNSQANIVGPMTYLELFKQLKNFTQSQLLMNVTISMEDEKFQVWNTVFIADETQEVLDIGHPYLSIK